MRIALATCSRLPGLDDDSARLLTALPEAEPVVWDSAADWDAFDLVVVRSTWDYTFRAQEFLAWARSVPRLANPADVLSWNTDKTYLQELEAAGVPVVPTTWLRPGDTFTPPQGAFVIKPTVSAGARDTARYDEPSGSAIRHAEALLDAGRQVMVQPYLHGVDEHGETSVLMFEGEFSHGARKEPLLEAAAGVRQDLSGASVIEARTPTDDELSLARQALGVVGQELLYARVDIVPGPDGRPVILELELTEPTLFLACSPAATEHFAAAVRARAARMSPGGPSSRS